MKKTISLQTSAPLWAALSALALFVLGLAACGGSSSKAVTVEKPTGKALYVSYCEICHGEHGDGPMADMLKVAPPDLTLISYRREDGKFPEEQMRRMIDGRDSIEGHGNGDMPVWGATFHVSEGTDNEQVVKERIDMLVKYLESIQRLPEK